VPGHDSLASKLACARLLREETGICRDILVDDLAGTVHRAYGLMPNMTWVIDRGGRVAYKANWTSGANVEAFLGRLLAARGPHPAGAVPVMYETEQIEFRRTDRGRFTEQLRRNLTGSGSPRLYLGCPAPAVRIQAAGRVARDGQDAGRCDERARLIECQLADTCLPGRHGAGAGRGGGRRWLWWPPKHARRSPERRQNAAMASTETNRF
jgi:hypothetical protein